MKAIDAERQAALMSLYYYGEAHYRKELTPPSSLPRHLRVDHPKDAISRLEQDRHPGYQSVLRLALAEIVSAHEAFTSTYSDYVQRLSAAVGVKAESILTLPAKFFGSVEDARAKRFHEAYTLAAGGACQVRNFQLQASYQDHISNVMTSIEVNRPVNVFVNGLDPRKWSETIPLVWEKSFEIAPGPLGLDRSQDPAPATTPSTPPFTNRFFEKADWSISLGTAIAYWRTILEIKLQQSLAGGPTDFIRFDYWLYECLENEFFFEKNPGGIDVDHGHGACQVVTADPTWSKLEAQKVVRFTQPTPVINDLTFVFLIIWFSDLILTAACA